MAKIKMLKDINDETVYPQTVGEAIVDGSIPFEKIDGVSISTDMVEDDAITNDKIANTAVKAQNIDWSTFREYATTSDGGKCYKLAGLTVIVWNRVSKTPDTRYHAVAFEAAGSGISNILWGDIAVVNDAASGWINHLVRMNNIEGTKVQGIVMTWNATDKKWDAAPNTAINFFTIAIGF